MVDALGDPLVHLVRNAVDHGLERPDDRLAAGKPRQGTIEIAARHAGGSVVIEVRDDGNGIDPHAIARKALSLGMIDEDAAAAIDMRGAVELLFTSGFSTAETTNDISGRGVGMDAVREKIRQLGGEVVIDSTPGVGTLAQIRLPLTLAIVSALQVEVSGAPFAIPIDRIERTLRLSEQTVRSVAGKPMLVLEDGVLPLLDSAEVFGREIVADARIRRDHPHSGPPLGARGRRPGRPAGAGHAAAAGDRLRRRARVRRRRARRRPHRADRRLRRPRRREQRGGHHQPRRLEHRTRTQETGPLTPRYTELQLDALRELANIASGTAATALSQMLRREVRLSVPRVLALPLVDAVEACGSPDESITSVVIPLEGDIDWGRAAPDLDRGRRRAVPAARR